VAHAVDLFVDLRVFFYVGVGAGDVGLRLVVVVVADEVFHRVVGEEAFHLAIELRRERLVGGEDQGRLLHRLDHLGHGEGLARAGDAKQHLIAVLGADAAHEFGDRGGLVAGGLVLGHDLEAARQGFGRLLLGMNRAGGGIVRTSDMSDSLALDLSVPPGVSRGVGRAKWGS